MEHKNNKIGLISFIGGCFGLFLHFKLNFLLDWNGAGYNYDFLITLVTLILFSSITALIFIFLSFKSAIQANVVSWILAILIAFTFQKRGYNFPLGLSANVIFWSSIASVIIKYYLEKSSKDSIIKIFKSYVSPELVEIISRNPEKFRLDGEEREITILFSDLQGFTTLAEKIPPIELVKLMNQYFTGLNSVIFKYGGTVDKFIGDAVMAFWNAPIKSEAHAVMSIKCALEIDNFSDEFFKGLPEICNSIGFVPKTKIGINSGKAIIGNIGSVERITYTAMGDQINLAARIEGLNGVFGTTILISKPTYDLLKKSTLSLENNEVYFIDRVIVKGKSQFTDLYTFAKKNSSHAYFLSRYQQLWNLYLDRKFDEILSQSDSLKNEFPDNLKLIQVLIDRCVDLKITNPPENWNGGHEFKNK